MILITGGLGFLGVSLAKYLVGRGQQVLVTRHRNPNVPEILAPHLDRQLHVAPMDITRLPTILDAIKKYKVSSMIHAAGTSEKGGSLYQVFETNVVGSINVLEAARLTDIGRITFVSSEGVNQGRTEATPLKEEEFFWARSDRYVPLTKKMEELLSFMYNKEYKTDIVVTRPSRIYGPFYTSGRNPILRMVRAAVKGGKDDLTDVNPLECHDFVYVRDCARAVAIIHMAAKPKHDLYNVGFGKLHSYEDVAQVLQKIILGASLKLGSGEFATITKTPYDINACLDVSRIKEELGYVPEYDLEKGIAALAAWVRDGSFL
jgi:UDP-glucose 4-epimerase